MSSPAPQDVTLEAVGVALHALERNPTGDPPLLLLHGWLDHCHSFDWVCDQLPGAWRTLALDFCGHGQSGHLRQGIHHFTDYIADVDAAVKHLGGAAHLVGHSMGGAISLLYAAARPERVRSVTVIESLGPLGRPAENAAERLREYAADLEKPARRRTYASLAEAVARVRANNSSLSERAAEHLTRFGVRAVAGGVEFTFDPALRRASPLLFDEAQILSVLSGIRCPVQVIHATHGFTFDDAQMKERLRRLGSPAVHQVEGGHHVHLDRPAEVAAHIHRFVERTAKG